MSATTALLAASPPTDYPVLYSTVDNGSNWETLSDGMTGVSGLPKGTWGDLSFVNGSEGWAAVITQTPTQSGSSNTVSGGGGSSGTTSGTYTITVTAASGSTSVSTPVSLTVQ